MKTTYRHTLIIVAMTALSGQGFAQSSPEHPDTPAPAHERQAPAVESNLKTFDVLDFDCLATRSGTGCTKAIPRTSW
jgi:hypothetical protein